MNECISAAAHYLPSQFGYVVYRQVINYYSGEEDAYGTCSSDSMRSCSSDV